MEIKRNISIYDDDIRHERDITMESQMNAIVNMRDELIRMKTILKDAPITDSKYVLNGINHWIETLDALWKNSEAQPPEKKYPKYIVNAILEDGVGQVIVKTIKIYDDANEAEATGRCFMLCSEEHPTYNVKTINLMEL